MHAYHTIVSHLSRLTRVMKSFMRSPACAHSPMHSHSAHVALSYTHPLSLQLEDRDERIKMLTSQIEALKVMTEAAPAPSAADKARDEELAQKTAELQRKTQMLQKCKELIKKLQSEQKASNESKPEGSSGECFAAS